MGTIAYEQEKWSLDELFTALDSPGVSEAIEDLEKQVAHFEGYRSALAEDMPANTFSQLLVDYDRMIRSLSRLASFASLRFSEDTQDQRVQAFLAANRQRLAEVDNRTLFFKLWWKALEAESATRLLEAAGDFRYWLEAMRLQSPYTLSEPEEKIVNLKDVNGVSALVTIYTAITNRYVFEIEVEGETKRLTRDGLMAYVRSPKADIRKKAYQALYEVFEPETPILGQFYQYVVRDWYSENVELRGFSSPISVRNLANDIPDDVTDMLLDVCRANANVFQDYFRLKGEWLGMDKLRRYDVYAPVAQEETNYTFDEAARLTLDSFSAFHPHMAELARKVFDEHHLDSEVRMGKRSGAFCSTVEPDLTPWVLTNYQGKAEDVLTLAHELGHAVHSLLASDHQALTQDPSLPLAETASTFGEMLVLDRLLSSDPDPGMKRDLLIRQMDGNFATIHRQAYFAMFEREAHDAVNQGASVDELSDIYWANLQDQFGDSLELSEDFKVEWAAIPHFYFSPFYVYAYAFGQLLVLSLYQQFREEGESFIPRYIEILGSGGSASPEAILSRAGIDMHERDFWQGGFDVLRRSVDDLKSMSS
jgi:oligoendopeptidase F